MARRQQMTTVLRQLYHVALGLVVLTLLAAHAVTAEVSVTPTAAPTVSLAPTSMPTTATSPPTVPIVVKMFFELEYASINASAFELRYREAMALVDINVSTTVAAVRVSRARISSSTREAIAIETDLTDADEAATLAAAVTALRIVVYYNGGAFVGLTQTQLADTGTGDSGSEGAQENGDSGHDFSRYYSWYTNLWYSVPAGAVLLAVILLVVSWNIKQRRLRRLQTNALRVKAVPETFKDAESEEEDVEASEPGASWTSIAPEGRMIIALATPQTSNESYSTETAFDSTGFPVDVQVYKSKDRQSLSSKNFDDTLAQLLRGRNASQRPTLSPDIPPPPPYPPPVSPPAQQCRLPGAVDDSDRQDAGYGLWTRKIPPTPPPRNLEFSLPMGDGYGLIVDYDIESEDEDDDDDDDTYAVANAIETILDMRRSQGVSMRVPPAESQTSSTRGKPVGTSSILDARRLLVGSCAAATQAAKDGLGPEQPDSSNLWTDL
eukprot:m.105109 g.105109  ORF g.105109 m.105109 type:complete len:494 (-) comp20991_c0_seq1:64-1545(-)